MLQWVPPDRKQVIYNVRGPRGYESVLLDLGTGSERRLPRAVYTLSPDGQTAISNDFARLAHTRPGYGYVGVDDPNRTVHAPADSGFWSMDLATGQGKLIVSIARLAQLRPAASMRDTIHWVNHALFNPDGTRFVFVHRWRTEHGFDTRLCTCAADGADLRLIADGADPNSWHASHFWWRDSRTLIVWAQFHDASGAYLLVEDGSMRTSTLSRSLLWCNGHMSYQPDPTGRRRWICSDTYPDPDTSRRTLFLYDTLDDRRVDVAELDASALDFRDPILATCRCDLHPRWSRSGRTLCIDSLHEGSRGIYTVDVGEVIN